MIKLGTSGIANMLSRHCGTQICKKMMSLLPKDGAKKLKNGSLLGMWGTKKAAIPSTITPTQPVVNQPLDRLQDSGAAGDTASLSPGPTIPQFKSAFLNKFHAIICNLPDSVPLGTDNDKLSVFSQDPANFDQQDVSSEDLWEVVLNGTLKEYLGWGTEDQIITFIRRGQKGMDGMLSFVAYFIETRGVPEGLFEGKLAHILAKAEEL